MTEAGGWTPDEDTVEHANLTRFLAWLADTGRGEFADYHQLWSKSVRRHRLVLGRGVALLRHPRDDARRHRAGQPGNAWGTMVSGRDAELRRSRCSGTRATSGRRSLWPARTVRPNGRGRGCGTRPRRSPTTCAGSASSRATGSSATCRTSARRSSPSSARPASVRPGRCATRTSPSRRGGPAGSTRADRAGGQRRFGVRREAP